jgi:uncharacterized protein YggU (UPF0235/DUF167 family)
VASARARLRLRVAPGARRSAVEGRHGEAWKLRVAAPPERGRANDEVLALIATTLELPRTAVRLVSGGSSRDKLVELDGMALEEAERRLERAGSRT